MTYANDDLYFTQRIHDVSLREVEDGWLAAVLLESSIGYDRFQSNLVGGQHQIAKNFGQEAMCLKDWARILTFATSF